MSYESDLLEVVRAFRRSARGAVLQGQTAGVFSHEEVTAKLAQIDAQAVEMMEPAPGEAEAVLRVLQEGPSTTNPFQVGDSQREAPLFTPLLRRIPLYTLVVLVLPVALNSYMPWLKAYVLLPTATCFMGALVGFAVGAVLPRWSRHRLGIDLLGESVFILLMSTLSLLLVATS